MQHTGRPASNLGCRAAMDALCEKYKSDAALEADPISIPRAFEDAADREFVSWVAAHLAYGKVGPMLRAIRRVVAPMGSSPAEWVRGRDHKRVRDELHGELWGWVWRFHTLEDMVEWVLAWQRLDASTGRNGVEPLLLPGEGASADQRLSELVNSLRASMPDTRGLRFNLPDPLKGAACKRWRMFLRWMVRRGWPDFGVWRRYPQEDLVIPLDTHVHRISRQVGLGGRKAQDAKAAAEITESLRALDAGDPLKYDFAIAHLGILGDCTGNRRPRCADCPLMTVCPATVL